MGFPVSDQFRVCILFVVGSQGLRLVGLQAYSGFARALHPECIAKKASVMPSPSRPVYPKSSCRIV